MLSAVFSICLVGSPTAASLVAPAKSQFDTREIAKELGMPEKDDFAWMTVPDEPVASIWAGNYTVQGGGYMLPGFQCDETTFANGSVAIFYPQDAPGPVPIVSFMHGSGGSIFRDLCSSIASLGIVVVAPRACGDWSQQQLHTISGSEQYKFLHPALANVDFGRAGIIGHSEGAAYTIGSTTSYKRWNVNLKAAVASHGASFNAAPNMPVEVPFLAVSGSADHARHKLAQSWAWSPSRPKIYAVLEGGPHMEPMHGGRMNEFDAHFLGCYLLDEQNKQRSCEKIYGTAPDSICKKNPMTNCQIVTE